MTAEGFKEEVILELALKLDTHSCCRDKALGAPTLPPALLGGCCLAVLPPGRVVPRLPTTVTSPGPRDTVCIRLGCAR